MFRISIRASRSLSLQLAHERIECVCPLIFLLICWLCIFPFAFDVPLVTRKQNVRLYFFLSNRAIRIYLTGCVEHFFREILKITVSLIYASHMKMLIQWRKSKKGDKRHTRKIFGWICVRYKNNFYWCYSVMLFRSLRN